MSFARPSTAAAQQAVFETAELLENIMRQLPNNTILVSQRVCRQFRDIVATSVTLRQKLFLAPLLKDEVWELSKEHPAGGFRQVALNAHVDFNSAQVARFKPAQLNPVLVLKDPSRKTDLMKLVNEYAAELEMKDPLRYKDMEFFGPSSAYITDPPCTQIEFTTNWAMTSSVDRVAKGRFSLYVSNPSGVTFKHIWDALHHKTLTFSYGNSTATDAADITFDELHEELLSKGFESAVFGRYSSWTLYDMVVPSDEEWKAVREYEPEH